MRKQLDEQFQQDLKQIVFPAVGATVVREFDTRLDQRFRGDYTIEWRQRWLDIDIKAEQDTPPNFPVELLQDWQANDCGWFYTLRGEVWYGRYQDGRLRTVHRVSLQRLATIPHEVSKNFKARLAPGGYGNTVLIAVPLDVLIKERAAHIIWEESNGG